MNPCGITKRQEEADLLDEQQNGDTMTRHTPGPWKAVIHRYPNGKLTRDAYIYAPNGIDEHRHIAIMEGVDETMEANARLIAAAPELLDSLTELTDWMRSHCGPRDGIHEMLCRAVAVLEKASGKL